MCEVGNCKPRLVSQLGRLHWVGARDHISHTTKELKRVTLQFIRRDKVKQLEGPTGMPLEALDLPRDGVSEIP